MLLRRKWRWVVGAVGGLLAAFFVALPPLPDPLFPPHYSTTVLDRDGRVLRAFLAPDEQWRLESLGDELPEKLTQAVLTFEDRRFYSHPGVDPLAVARAAVNNLRGTSLSGASTITMQVARLALPKERTLWGKVVETSHAALLELRFSKDKILGFWLDNTPYGGNLVGVEAASRRYFGIAPEHLSWGQAAFLAVVPKSPNAALTDEGRKRLRERRNRLLDDLDLPEEDLQLALREPIPEVDYRLPFQAPHASRWLHQTRGAKGIIHTTLVEAHQRSVEAVVQRRAEALRVEGVPNIAVLVADTQTGDVVAYVGSQSFHDRAHNGQVDGVRAPRSSGSTLKPFLYANAIERGLMLPQTKLIDVPTHFGSFTPANFANEFSGLLTMRDALIKSANVPAVRTLADLGVPHFHEWLKAAGASTLFRPADDYGLSLILGGAEVTLWDLASLYRSLGRGGELAPLRLRATDANDASTTALMSPGSAWLVLDTLRDLRRPGAEYYWSQYANAWPIAWKTGTSYGQRDAWAVGVTPQWTIAVWAGDFVGQGNPRLTGTRTAAPVLFDVLAALPKDETKRWFAPPTDFLDEVALCAHSGFRAGPLCPDREHASAPRGGLPLEECPLHRTYYVEGSDQSEEEVCSLCWNDERRTVTRLVYPPSVNQWFRLHGHTPQESPPHRASCPSVPDSTPLELLQPQPDAILLIPRVDGAQRGAVTLRAAHARADALIHWYVDGAFLGTTRERHQRAVVLQPGKHRVQVLDSDGHHKRHTFTAWWRVD